MAQAKAVATSPPAGDSMVRRTTERVELLIASPLCGNITARDSRIAGDNIRTDGPGLTGHWSWIA
jgi:hypothetical protein